MIYNILNFSDPAKYKFYGRTVIDEKGGLHLSWPSSGVEFNFKGDGIIFGFEELHPDAVIYMRVFVDGRSARYGISDGKEKIIIENLGEGNHNVKILKVTEGEAVLNLNEVILTGEKPELLIKPADKKLKMEFIGDSLTCGYGVCGAASSTDFYTYEEDSTKSFAYQTAMLLDADTRMVGASGKGIISNCIGDRNDFTVVKAFEIENRDGGKWDYSKWIPDVVVVNVGTNDAWGKVEPDEFTEGAIAFIKTIRKAYKDAKIVWAYGILEDSFTSAIEKAVNEVAKNDDKVFFVPLENIYKFEGEIGGGGHPNTKTSARVSAVLSEKIKEIL